MSDYVYRAQLVIFETGHILFVTQDSFRREMLEEFADLIKQWRETDGKDIPVLCIHDVDIRYVRGRPEITLL